MSGKLGQGQKRVDEKTIVRFMSECELRSYSGCLHFEMAEEDPIVSPDVPPFKVPLQRAPLAVFSKPEHLQ